MTIQMKKICQQRPLLQFLGDLYTEADCMFDKFNDKKIKTTYYDT